MFEVLMLALAATTASPAEIRLPPDSHFYYAPPVAIDHEAVVVSHRVSGSNTSAGQNERRHTIVRSGSWLREGGTADGRTGFAYSDFAAGISITYSSDADGYQGLIIRRYADSDNYGLFQRRPTGTRERVLGEDCEIWRTTRVRPIAGAELDLLSCDTADGIQLWSRAVGSRGVIIAESRTISFRRRPVRPEEIRPPADLLRWAHWRSLAAREPLPAWLAHRPRNYELHLQGGVDAYEGERERLLRSHDDWSYADTIRHRGDRSVRIDNRVIMVDYQADANGRPVALVIQRLQPGWSGWRAYVAVDPPASESVIGEACTWSHQFDYRYCVTADGLPLRIREHHHGLMADLTATRLIRRQPPLAAVMPPAEAFEWARWDVQPIG